MKRNPPKHLQATQAAKPSESKAVDVHVKLTENMGLMSIAGRPRTAVGPQVDHTTAYALFEYILKEAVVNKPIDAAVGCVIKAVEYMQSSEQRFDIDEIFTSFKNETQVMYDAILKQEELQNIQNSSDHTVAALYEKIVTLRNTTVQVYLSRLIECLANRFLTYRNQLAFVSFPREGSLSADKDEGAKIKTAIQSLKALEDGWAAIQDSEKEDKINEIVEQMAELFFYPKIDEKDLFDLSKKEDLDEWEKIKKQKGYRVNTLPRNNDLDMLALMITRHLILINACFEGFHNSLGNYLAIRDTFVEKIAMNWGLDKTQKTELYEKITSNATLLSYQADAISGSEHATSSGHSSHHSEEEDTQNTTVNEKTYHSDSDEDFVPPPGAELDVLSRANESQSSGHHMTRRSMNKQPFGN